MIPKNVVNVTIKGNYHSLTTLVNSIDDYHLLPEKHSRVIIIEAGTEQQQTYPFDVDLLWNFYCKNKDFLIASIRPVLPRHNYLLNTIFNLEGSIKVKF